MEQGRAGHASEERAGRQGGAVHTDVRSLEGTVAERLGITIVELSAERVVGTMPVTGASETGGPMQTAASCMLAETLAWYGASAHGGPESSASAIEISATHHRPARDGDLTAVATRVHGGRTLATYDVKISDSGNRRVCTARLTCLLRPAPADRPGNDHRAGEAGNRLPPGDHAGDGQVGLPG